MSTAMKQMTVDEFFLRRREAVGSCMTALNPPGFEVTGTPFPPT
jgi:hypothetical protein